MHKVRVIPVLLLRNWGLEKTVQFRDPKYVGCPINAARVFTGRNVDELILLDIVATHEGRGPQLEIVRQIAAETFMPFTVGGGVRDIDGMWELLKAGADRVVINSAAAGNPRLLEEGADRFGRQCMVASIDARMNKRGVYEVWTRGATVATELDPVQWAKAAADAGAGEILLNSIDRDGMMQGYDIGLTRAVADAVSVPVIACGGAGSVKDLADAVYEGHASAVAAGAFFLFYGKRRTVLITYPTDAELAEHFRPEHIRRKDPMEMVDGAAARL